MEAKNVKVTICCTKKRVKRILIRGEVCNILTRSFFYYLHDGEALEQAIGTKAGYIGMIRSKTKFALLYKGLIDKGMTKALPDRVYARIGLDIHSERPTEIAISIMAQLIKVRAENAKGERYI